MKIVILLVVLGFSFTKANAKDSSSLSPMEIEAINFYSKEESIHPTHKGLVQVSFKKSIHWRDEANCSKDWVVVRNEDTHILSALLTARTTSTPVRLYVDDSLKARNDCFLRALGY